MAKYPDLNVHFKTVSVNPANIVGIETIKQALERLFMTGKGEVPFNRDYGSSLKYLLFENNNYSEEDIAVFLYQDICEFEPRVELNPNDISIIQEDMHTYSITCNFYVPDLNEMVGSISTVVTDTV